MAAFIRCFLSASFILALYGGSVWAVGGRCAHCSCDSACQKVCRLVKEEKRVEVVCWGCECVDFCLPGPSQRGCEHCESVCLPDPEGDKNAPCVKAKSFVWTEWIPGCGPQIHTKKKLMKKTVVKKIPSFKWVVEDLCPRCESKVTAAEFDPDAAIPLPPMVNGRLMVGRSEATVTQSR